MAHRRTECRNAVAEMVESFPQAKVNFGHGGKHQIADLTVGAKTARIFFASTPSDRNAYKNAARNARRILIELGATQEK
jgi:hypothetical protein